MWTINPALVKDGVPVEEPPKSVPADNPYDNLDD